MSASVKTPLYVTKADSLLSFAIPITENYIEHRREILYHVNEFYTDFHLLFIERSDSQELLVFCRKECYKRIK